ncbi:YjjG family noncanonical pyrimidine nucleotidase [Vagococcus elongatus]|uniref:Noncanonical pyrimidine nucleotidase, YjjG family n=1 Tax=Vagococcus elongatus TaxID=180344 RepID=A0A430AN02_9ENTE|nr:YjjG family noncanonical pyrimidine nucleotidase [Vagococcus elongatus]RSU09469.1 noncanonical pyrimidine nucleotidase, YjjG family [Vagococcus elongatus]
MNYSTVLMDLDNTILSFDQAEEYALKKLFEEEEVPWQQEIFQRYHIKNKELWEELEKGIYQREHVLSERFVYIFQLCGKKVDGDEMDQRFRHHLSEKIFFMPEALKTLDKLKEKKIHLHMVTNGVAVTQYRRIKKAKIGHYFNQLFISEEVGYQKPAKEFFQHVFERIEEKDTSKVLMMGDSLSADIKGGNQAGIDTCWYTEKKTVGSQEITPTYHITRLDDVLTIV